MREIIPVSTQVACLSLFALHNVQLAAESSTQTVLDSDRPKTVAA